jgi:hypothetical protein
MTRVTLLFFSFVFVSANAVAATGSASGGKGKALGSAADTAHGSSGGGGGSSGSRTLRDPRKAPPLDESRKVSEQDCSRPVDPQAGNLRCK